MRKAVVSNLKAVVKAIVGMNYSAAELHHMAIDDLFAGPEYIFEDLPTVVGRVREVRKQFEDAVVLPAHPGDFDANVDAITLEGLSQIPKTALRGYLNVALGLRHALTPSRPGRLPRRADLTGHDPTWAVLSRLDEVLVATSDGAGISKRSRNQRAVRRLIARAVADHVRVMQSADELRRMYRAGLGKMTSPDRWSEIFS
jgi:galactofuranosylgalactofuranosylrhamnosyl-N-acetylglucosaminyl-diphospho-decaprenol beta-1,5/1,6-galactofuranosyltransferase